ncbi:hypothetical protein QJQ45_009236 [Haematococcus lacustris]|nr:hypothetical protein QJQ45_009236 [Haematococcus lacustris]
MAFSQPGADGTRRRRKKWSPIPGVAESLRERLSTLPQTPQCPSSKETRSDREGPGAAPSHAWFLPLSGSAIPCHIEAKGGHITASKQSNDAPRKAMADVTNGPVNCNGKTTLAVEAKTCSRSSRSDVLRAAVMVIRQQQEHRSSHATGKGAAPGKVHSPRSQALTDLSLGTAQLQEQAARAAALALQHLLACDSLVDCVSNLNRAAQALQEDDAAVACTAFGQLQAAQAQWELQLSQALLDTAGHQHSWHCASTTAQSSGLSYPTPPAPCHHPSQESSNKVEGSSRSPGAQEPPSPATSEGSLGRRLRNNIAWEPESWSEEEAEQRVQGTNMQQQQQPTRLGFGSCSLRNGRALIDLALLLMLDAAGALPYSPVTRHHLRLHRLSKGAAPPYTLQLGPATSGTAGSNSWAGVPPPDYTALPFSGRTHPPTAAGPHTTAAMAAGLAGPPAMTPDSWLQPHLLASQRQLGQLVDAVYSEWLLQRVLPAAELAVSAGGSSAAGSIDQAGCRLLLRCLMGGQDWVTGQLGTPHSAHPPAQPQRHADSAPPHSQELSQAASLPLQPDAGSQACVQNLVLDQSRLGEAQLQALKARLQSLFLDLGAQLYTLPSAGGAAAAAAGTASMAPAGGPAPATLIAVAPASMARYMRRLGNMIETEHHRPSSSSSRGVVKRPHHAPYALAASPKPLPPRIVLCFIARDH